MDTTSETCLGRIDTGLQLEKALAFYRDMLGLKLQLDGRVFTWIELGPEKPLCKIGLYERKEGLPRGYPIMTGITLDTDDVQGLYKRLEASGARFANFPKKLDWGGWSADFLDPDGNSLNVVQDPGHHKRMPPVATERVIPMGEVELTKGPNLNGCYSVWKGRR